MGAVNEREAAKWWKLCHERRFTRCSRVLAELYLTGRGVPKDAAEAAFILKTVVDREEPDADPSRVLYAAMILNGTARGTLGEARRYAQAASKSYDKRVKDQAAEVLARVQQAESSQAAATKAGGPTGGDVVGALVGLYALAILLDSNQSPEEQADNDAYQKCRRQVINTCQANCKAIAPITDYARAGRQGCLDGCGPEASRTCR
jgi:TPR repeat protein